MAKFKKGDKVVAISKSYGESFEESGTLRDMRYRKLDHIYFVRMEGETCICDADKYGYGSGYFLEKDLIPYSISLEELNTQLLNGQIDVVTYQARKKDVK